MAATKSEASQAHLKDMLFNGAETLGAAARPAQSEPEVDNKAVDIPDKKRAKRGRKPLDFAHKVVVSHLQHVTNCRGQCCRPPSGKDLNGACKT